MTPANEGQAKPFQFTLWHLAMAILSLSLFLALIVQLGGFGVFIFLVISSALATLIGWRNGNRAWLTLGGIGLSLIAISILLTPTCIIPSTVARESQCHQNLRQIGAALDNYHDRFGSYPPAYVADKGGRPIHSWRVLILPFLDQKVLYDAYNFNEPWNGPNNRKLADRIPSVFQCPSDNVGDSSQTSETSYVAIIGPNTVWQGATAVTRRQIRDGCYKTVFVAECHDSGINWMEPRDLHVIQMANTINSPHGQGINSVHRSKNDAGRGQGVIALFGDGSSRFLSNNIPPETLRAILSIAGGETVGDY